MRGFMEGIENQKRIIMVLGVGGPGCRIVSRTIQYFLSRGNNKNTDIIMDSAFLFKEISFIQISNNIYDFDESYNDLCKNELTAQAKKKETDKKKLCQFIEIPRSEGLCFGTDSIERNARLYAESSKKFLVEAIKDADAVIIMFALSGLFGGGTIPVILDLCRTLRVLSLVIASAPFIFEGTHRNERAKKQLANMQKMADKLIIISGDDSKASFNDLLQSINTRMIEALNTTLCTMFYDNNPRIT